MLKINASQNVWQDFYFYFDVFLFVFFLLLLLRLIYLEKNKKRDIRDWYQSGSDRYSDRIDDKSRELRRGDIPVLHGDCDGK